MLVCFNLRGVYGDDLLLIAGLDKLSADEEAQWLGPLAAIGSGKFDFHIPELEGTRE